MLLFKIIVAAFCVINIIRGITVLKSKNYKDNYLTLILSEQNGKKLWGTYLIAADAVILLSMPLSLLFGLDFGNIYVVIGAGSFMAVIMIIHFAVLLIKAHKK